MNDRKVSNPPAFIIKLLRWFCPDHLLEEIEGDLIQKFVRDVKEFGESSARRRYVWSAIRFFRPGIILRNKFSTGLNGNLMLKNYFVMAFRHLQRDWTFSSISILGLSLSIAVFLLIFQYSFFELRYDRFNVNADHTYRITMHSYENDQAVYESALSPTLAGPALKERLPEVTAAAQLVPTRSWFDCTLRYDDGDNAIVFNERNLFYATSSIFEIFSFPLVQGDKLTALEKPFSAVLSASTAKRYFGDAEPVGKVLHLKGSLDENDYVVTAVMADLPDDSHIEADVMLSMSSLEHNANFQPSDAYTYVQLAPGVDLESLRIKLRNFATTYFPELVPDKMKIHLAVQPITRIHLHSSLQDEIKPGGDAMSIYFLLLVAVFILIIAWINYINLATSRSLSRAKEIGIRKVSGASRMQLVFQLLSESIVINAVSAGMALLLVYFLSPVFYELTGLAVSYVRIYELGLSSTGLIIALIFCAGIFVSGFYPARMVSAHNPALVLKGKVYGKKSGLTLRKALVVFQFTCAIVLTIAVLTFHEQFRFMQNQDLGIDINKTLVVKAPTTFATELSNSYLTRLANFKKEMQARAIIGAVTTSSAIPGEKIGWTGLVRNAVDQSGPQPNFIINVVDTDFLSAYDLRLLAGRNFEISDFPGSQFGNKTEPVILNKTATDQLGFRQPENAVGESVFWGDNECVVVGVIDDFHQQSLKDALQPILFTANNGPLLSMKLGKAVNDGNLKASVLAIQQAWKKFFPDNPFDYFFLDDFYDSQYANDRQVMALFEVFCGIALLISALGLFGLSSFSARQRTRELSIRKVLGAPIFNLFALLTKEFLLLILIASCLAIPLSYLGIDWWLDSFVFHITPSGRSFVIPVLLTLVIAFLTVSFQTFKAVYTNPVDSLKCE
jgi:putative ABC transport system permease protein